MEPAPVSTVFIDPVCPAPYSLATLQERAMGGTEATVVRIAEQLDACVAQRGRARDEGRYVAYEHVRHAERLIVLRDPAALVQWQRRLPTARPYLWLHDLLTAGSRQATQLQRHAPALAAMRATAICVSEFHCGQARAALQRAGVTLPVVRIYNPIADELRLRDAPVDRHKLVFASQPKKGLELALLAFRHLRAADARFRLCVANPGYRRVVRRAAAGVEWLGELPHARVLEEIATALCVFYPNCDYPETFGLVFAESNALGTPVLTYPVGAAAEVLRDERQIVPIDRRLRTAQTWSRRLPRGPMRRWALQAGGALGAFAAYRDRVLQWSQGERPLVTGRSDFRLSQVVQDWHRLLHAQSDA